MSYKEDKAKLTAKQVLTRIVSILACGAGIAACLYSLSLQIQDVGNIVSSACWFSGLGSVVAAIAGYVVTCSPRHRNFVSAAVIAMLVLGVVAFLAERQFLQVHVVILLTLAVLVVQAIVLVVYHHLLKREDPLAL